MKKSVIKGMILCLGFILLVGLSNDCHAARFLGVTAQVKNKTKVEIKWRKKSVAGYDIYRAKCNKDGEAGKYKKIATVSGSKTKYVDKKVKYKKYYSYKVTAYKKKNGKKVTKYQGYVDTYTGMATPNWEDCLYVDAKTTSSSIQLIGYTDGLRPSGFEIYRKTGSSKYKKIKTIKTKNSYFTYVDQTVEKGKKYTYKYRSYRKDGKKMIYSKYSDAVRLTAVNRDAAYSMETLTKEGRTKTITIKLTSGVGNGETIIESNENYLTYHYHSSEVESDYLDMTVVAYSYDNRTWHDFPESGVKLAENQMVYIQLEEINGKEFTFGTKNAITSDLEWWITYNDRQSILWIDFLKGTAKATANGEYYH